jgi:hypothetical protein
LSFSTDCTVVDPAALPDLDDIMAGIAVEAQLTALSVAADGVAIPAPVDMVPALPQTGPSTVQLSTVVGPLGTAAHQICVTATGQDIGGTGAMADCVAVRSGRCRGGLLRTWPLRGNRW